MGRTGRNDQDDSPRVGGRYRLVEKLGTGGMSEVWRGHDETLGRSVAVKVLSLRLADDQMFRDRLRQEALAAARLCHPHITGIYDFGVTPLDHRLAVPYVVMELNDGESVAARIARRGPLGWRDAVRVVAEVASALATAHARGVVHRDVTPANVMLTPTGAKVVDFGISAIVGQRDAAPDGSLLGTPAYLAPERLSGAQVSAATDVYALGLLLYRTLTARLPWPAETTAEALRAHLYAEPSPLPEIKGLTKPVRDLCLRCLAKSPADRPAAADVARLLAAEVGIQPVIPPLSARETRQAAASPPPASCADPMSTVDQGAPTAMTPSDAVSVKVGAGAAEAMEAVEALVTKADAGAMTTVAASGVANAEPDAESRATLGRALLAYLGLPGGTPGPRPSLDRLRLRAGMKIATVLRVGEARPLGGGLFAGGTLARDMLTSRLRSARRGSASAAALSLAGSPPRSQDGSPPRTALLNGSQPWCALLTGSPFRSASPTGSPSNSASPPGSPSSSSSPTGSPSSSASPPGRPWGSALLAGSAFGSALLAGSPFGSPLLADGSLRDGGQRRTHRIRATLITMALLGTAGASWALTRTPPPEHEAQAAGTGAAPAVVTAPTEIVCAVRYQLRRDSGSRYEALLTVATIDEIALAPWRVQFSYPGTQRLTGTPRAVTQRGRKVVAKGSGRLQTFRLRGAYNGNNPLPFTFTLDGHRCRAEILGGVTPRTAKNEPISEAAGTGRKPPRGEAADRPHRERAPRKSSTSRSRVGEPSPPRSATKPSPGSPPLSRKGEGFSLAL